MPTPDSCSFDESYLLIGTGCENLLCAEDDEWP